MRFIHRLGYYLGGFAIGLLLLAFFLSGKRTSCSYGPDARTIKNINLKKRLYSEEARLNMSQFQLDTLQVSELINSGDVNFSESDTKGDACHTYLIENEFENQDMELWIENCDSVATVQSIVLRKED
ncbi:DUF4258 domain-containing protein [Subsaximicrobium wynnwilliamsii]|uniref:DUF4258 domain-containing protein n=1 Tax=Subsaximicrobium wynnwilliamsii TaxID=291179 RepID=A0A5C6ZFS4_9FLAO|nr:DUF4258 domain-containing protein [Subsaximicrobium wynnwilliamsii]TXD84149.1 DUF4258 domain-containing protein [Subsaximicrobium wynnwilliamsii]TXD88893.1 DUF4258 domain-containing protein [Subsaximicrobium wynnwilliamsii]TXE03861.1 DUF4258 domain-containing protein [Subsaximicrobium wynnwilliamsii]